MASVAVTHSAARRVTAPRKVSVRESVGSLPSRPVSFEAQTLPERSDNGGSASIPAAGELSSGLGRLRRALSNKGGDAAASTAGSLAMLRARMASAPHYISPPSGSATSSPWARAVIRTAAAVREQPSGRGAVSGRLRLPLRQGGVATGRPSGPSVSAVVRAAVKSTGRHRALNHLSGAAVEEEARLSKLSGAQTPKEAFCKFFLRVSRSARLLRLPSRSLNDPTLSRPLCAVSAMVMAVLYITHVLPGAKVAKLERSAAAFFVGQECLSHSYTDLVSWYKASGRTRQAPFQDAYRPLTKTHPRGTPGILHRPPACCAAYIALPSRKRHLTLLISSSLPQVVLGPNNLCSRSMWARRCRLWRLCLTMVRPALVTDRRFYDTRRHRTCLG